MTHLLATGQLSSGDAKARKTLAILISLLSYYLTSLLSLSYSLTLSLSCHRTLTILQSYDLT